MAGTAIPINRENCTLEELDRVKLSAQSLKDYSRLEAIWFLYRGYLRKEVEELLKLSSRTLRHWVKQFNERGLDGLVTLARSGRPRMLSKEEFSDSATSLLDSKEAFSVVKLHGYLSKDLKYDLSYSTVLRYVHQEGYALKVPRRTHPEQDPEARQRFIAELNELRKREDVEIWFGDEVGIEGDPRPSRSWFKKGSKPRVPYAGQHLRQSVIGAVQPSSGELCALAVPYTDTGVFQLFVNELVKQTKGKDKTVIFIIDNASWHHAGAINWYHLQPMFLPAYSPDLNPIERLWLVLKERSFKNYYTRNPDKLLERVCSAIGALMETPEVVASICHISA
jgi:transposase